MVRQNHGTVAFLPSRAVAVKLCTWRVSEMSLQPKANCWSMVGWLIGSSDGFSWLISWSMKLKSMNLHKKSVGEWQQANDTTILDSDEAVCKSQSRNDAVDTGSCAGTRSLVTTLAKTHHRSQDASEETNNCVGCHIVSLLRGSLQQSNSHPRSTSSTKVAHAAQPQAYPPSSH